MGQRQSSTPPPVEIATLEEVTADWRGGDIYNHPVKKLHNFEAFGNSKEEALKNFLVVCQENGIPQPTVHKRTRVCGTVDIYVYGCCCCGDQVVRRANPLWYSERNGRHKYSVMYPKM